MLNAYSTIGAVFIWTAINVVSCCSIFIYILVNISVFIAWFKREEAFNRYYDYDDAKKQVVKKCTCKKTRIRFNKTSGSNSAKRNLRYLK